MFDVNIWLKIYFSLFEQIRLGIYEAAKTSFKFHKKAIMKNAETIGGAVYSDSVVKNVIRVR